MAPYLKPLFLLDPDVIFLNHGSFGACPRPVFEAYQAWQLRLERQPVLFLGREFPALERAAAQPLAAYLHTPPENLVFVPNATYGVNAVARSLRLEPGDEVLTTDHEYGACDYTWDFVASRSGARIARQPIPLTLDDDEILEHLWRGVSGRTRVVYVSHITSPTAMRFPVKAICARARAEGILSIVDGAHAPGQIPLDLDDIGADYYTGNLHKWALAPKGAAFLYARPAAQELLDPMVVSWGFRAAPEMSTGSRFVDNYQWTGTRDPAALLAVPAALQFMEDQNWDTVRRACRDLLAPALERLSALMGMPQPLPLPGDAAMQMGIIPLPPETDLALLKTRLYDEHHIEIPTILWGERKFLRLSVQAYNSAGDIQALAAALARIFNR